MILIVGEAGYIGSHVNKLLNQEGFETVVFDNSALKEVEHVILEPESRNTALAIALGMEYCLEGLGWQSFCHL